MVIGPSGIGKTAAFNPVKNALTTMGGGLKDAFSTESLPPNIRPIIIETPFEYRRRIQMEGDACIVYFRSMTPKETAERVHQNPNNGVLDVAAIVHLSLGVPKLARRLADHLVTSQAIGRDFSGAYLFNEFRSDITEPRVLARHFDDIPPEVLSSARRVFSQGGRSMSQKWLDIQDAWEDDWRLHPEDPLLPLDFIDPLTEELINRQIQESDGYESPGVGILARVTYPQAKRLAPVFGVVGNIRPRLDEPAARRLQVYDASLRNAGIDISGYLGIRPESTPQITQITAISEQLKPHLPFSSGTNKVVLYKTDHPHLVISVRNFRLAVETHLQQDGVPYVAQDMISGVIYVYNPQQGRITIFNNKS